MAEHPGDDSSMLVTLVPYALPSLLFTGAQTSLTNINIIHMYIN